MPGWVSTQPDRDAPGVRGLVTTLSRGEGSRGAGMQSGIVTLLFTDIVASTAHLDRLGDDDYEQLRRTHFRLLREAVTANGGEEVKNLGDGLFVTFTSTLQAVESAVAMQQAIHRHNRSASPPLEIRIGLNVGEPIQAESDYFGTPVVVAQRLCQNAAGGQILASALVRDLVGTRGDFHMREIGPQHLKGISQPHPTVEIAWTSAPPTPLPAPLRTGAGSFFVERDQELEVLDRAWKAVQAGAGRAVLIAGEPGIGKSSLASEVARRASDAGARVLFGRCDEGLAVPYQPFLEALTSLVATTTPEVLRHQAGHKIGELVRLLPDLAQQLTDLPPPVRADAETERYQLFQAVAELLSGACEDQPLVLVLDDLHWAAKPTLLLLHHVLTTSAHASMLVIGTYRDTEVDRVHPLSESLDALLKAGAERIRLRGLDLAGVAAFMQASAGTALLDERAVDLVGALHEQTQGNPFFIGALLAHLVESGAVFEEDGRWTAPPGVGVGELGLPEGLKAVVTRRLSRLSEPSNRALRVAAVVGAAFRVDIVERACDLELDPLIEALDEALHAGLLVEAPGGYAFAHALIRQTILDELTAPRRMRLHRRIGEAIEALPAADRHLEALALHFAQASLDGQAEKAADYALAAAQRALAGIAYEQAMTILADGIAALDLADPPDHARRATLALVLSRAAYLVGDLDTQRKAALAAARDARTCGSAAQLAEAAIAHNGRGSIEALARDEVYEALCQEALAALGDSGPELRARLLSLFAWYQAWHQDKHGQGRIAESMAEEALALARQTNDDETLATALDASWFVLAGSGRADERLALAEEYVAVAHASESAVAASRSLMIRGATRLEQGDLAGFDADRAASNQIEEANALFGARADYQTAMRLMVDGRFEEAEAAVHAFHANASGYPNRDEIFAIQLFAIHRELGSADIVPLLESAFASHPELAATRAILAIASVDAGKVDAARHHLEALTAGDLAAVPRNHTMTGVLAWCAEVAATIGDAEAAGALYRALEPHAGQVLVPGQCVLCLGAADRYLGMLAAADRRWDEAEAHYRDALALEERIQSPPHLARTRYWYARTLVERDQVGDRQRAGDLLDASLKVAKELGMATLEQSAIDLLRTVP